MALRFDNVIGRILIDEDACNRDINYARSAIGALENANNRLFRIASDSQNTFGGQAATRFRAALNTLTRKNSEEINKLNEFIRIVQATIDRYRGADTSLAERFRH